MSPRHGRPGPVFRSAGQPRYVRPGLTEETYYNRDGEPIPYGRQWGEGGPDPDSYSVDSHPERFAGLHLVARALIDHLTAVYDVDVQEDPVHAGELLSERKDVLQAVKITPRNSRAAALTFVLTGYPGVMVHAGVLHDFAFPVCGCDACDETVETTADRMEMLVLSVAAGGYSERYPVGRKRWSEYVLAAFDGSGSESGQGEPASVSGRAPAWRGDPAAGGCPAGGDPGRCAGAKAESPGCRRTGVRLRERSVRGARWTGR